jgi:hypothetical protein
MSNINNKHFGVEDLDNLLQIPGAHILPLFEPVAELIEWVFPSYWKFVQRPRSESRRAGIDAIGLDSFLQWTLLWSVVFSLMSVLIPRASKRLFPKWWEGLDKRYKVEFAAYIVCTFHHFYIVPRSWYHIYVDYFAPETSWSKIDYGENEAIVTPFLMGYLIADMICYALPTRQVDYMIHHVLTAAIVWAGTNSDQSLSRFIPHLLSSDTSQLLLNSSWLLKRIGGLSESSPITKTLDTMFALSFPVVRLFIMPVAMLTVTRNPQYAKDMGIVRFVFLPLCILQYYWFGKIVLHVAGVKKPKKKAIHAESDSEIKEGKDKIQ